MSTTEARSKTTHEGNYATQQTHTLERGILEAAIIEFEAVAAKFAADAIKDSKTRERYMAHIKEVSDETRKQVDGGHITVKDGAIYINQLRDKLFVEYRRYTSAIGVVSAEKIKLKSRGFDYYLDKYAQRQFGKPFSQLTELERSKVYYTVIEAAGRPNDDVNASIRKMRVMAKVAILVTSLFAIGAIINADDKVKEAARQGSIIAGSMLGGGIAGLLVSFMCGPAEPVCAAILVYIGTSAGAITGEMVNDVYQDELDEFYRWTSK